MKNTDPYIAKLDLYGGQGHIILEDIMGSDLTAVNAAKISFNDAANEVGQHERGLINFLLSHRHGSVFEKATMIFDVKTTLYISHEHMRHRAGHSFNQVSLRYSKFMEEFYIPEKDYLRTQTGKPAAYVFEGLDESVVDAALDVFSSSQTSSLDAYNRLLELGVAKEIARGVLPTGAMTRYKWGCNLRSLMHFLSLRNHDDAQREIRDLAAAAEELIRPYFPVTLDCFNKHGRQSP